APGHQQMPSDRLHIKQLPLPTNLTLHTRRISAAADHRTTPRGFFSSLLAGSPGWPRAALPWIG
ncbi:MAG: hypothetical protein L0Y54_12775, partial [Sporichthyaceae bacterium]|nr:hypothetical protein [Sporichthyaceae bacterium]